MGGSNSSNCKCEVRIENSLNHKEAEFVAMRRKTVQRSLEKLQIHVDWDKVPNIALLGSGGGQRAMVGLLESLDQLDKAGLLDCILYLSGVSGSTWCMASLYQEPDWSTKLETVKDKIIQRLNGPEINRIDAIAKLKNYYFGKDFMNLTDYWSVIAVTKYVKEIDEHTLTDQWNRYSKDPFPIYTVIDKDCKQSKNGDPWFEITPYEAGYSLTGAFVETSNFGSKFENGCKIKHQPEIDMLYLQGLCGSAIADEEENEQFFSEQMQEFFGFKIPLDVLNLSPLKFIFRKSLDGFFSRTFLIKQPYGWMPRLFAQNQWIWGMNYNFLYNMKDERVPFALQEKETKDYIDAGVLLNSPYISVLRKERNIDLIISLDFSDGDPFMTVKKAAEICKKLYIPFPEVNIPKEDVKNPKDFYVFKGQNAPTVIHIPLFNVVNCGDDIEAWRNKYTTFQDSYNPEMIADLTKVAGKNITNNKDRLLEEIRVVAETKMYQ